MTKVAINGFGRIGRAFLKLALERPELEVVAINDLGTIENLSYLLRYDTVYGQWPHQVEAKEDMLMIDGKPIMVLHERDPKLLPWRDLSVDIVIEATGVFTTYEASKQHLEAGAKRVIVSGPVSDDPKAAGVEGATVLMGVNDDLLGNTSVTSNASCTANATSPLVAVLNASIGIEAALLNTVHAYTATQAVVDGPSKKDLRGGRAAAQNTIPSSTGAAKATTLAHTALAGKLDGLAIRVPVACGSIVDFTFIASRPTTVEEVNDLFKKAAMEPRWQGLLAVTEEPIVSSDIIGARVATIVDLPLTRVVGGNLVKVLSWYDNETGYTATLLKHTLKAAESIK